MPTAGARSGPLQRRRCMCPHPTGSRALAPTAEAPDALLLLRRRRCSRPTGSRAGVRHDAQFHAAECDTRHFSCGSDGRPERCGH
eukprot:scaffold306694_cov37-Tisochrysis_lutea.AAC.1